MYYSGELGCKPYSFLQDNRNSCPSHYTF